MALKVLNPGLSARPDQVDRFRREAQRLARVRHRNVVTVYGAAKHQGHLGLWMELIEGKTLESILRQRGPMGAREAALVGSDLCRAIAAVHAALDLGINYIDVAPAYGATRSETVLGKALRGIPRDQYFLSTKVGKTTAPGGYGADRFH